MRFYRLILFIILFPVFSFSEYRAYELTIVNTESGKTRTIISTLDHIQYPQYYPLNKGEQAEYVDSWMCWHNSSHFKEVCKKPDRDPADESPKTPSQ